MTEDEGRAATNGPERSGIIFPVETATVPFLMRHIYIRTEKEETAGRPRGATRRGSGKRRRGL